jgi:hypothetical protein
MKLPVSVLLDGDIADEALDSVEYPIRLGLVLIYQREQFMRRFPE